MSSIDVVPTLAYSIITGALALLWFGFCCTCSYSWNTTSTKTTLSVGLSPGTRYMRARKNANEEIHLQGLKELPELEAIRAMFGRLWPQDSLNGSLWNSLSKNYLGMKFKKLSHAFPFPSSLLREPG